MLENMVSSYGSMVCVDTFEGGEEHAGLDLSGLRQTFDSNVAEVLTKSQAFEVVNKRSWMATCCGVVAGVGSDTVGLDG